MTLPISTCKTTFLKSLFKNYSEASISDLKKIKFKLIKLNTFHAILKLLFRPEKNLKWTFSTLPALILYLLIITVPTVHHHKSNTANFHSTTIYIIHILGRQQLVTEFTISLLHPDIIIFEFCSLSYFT